MPTVTVGFGSRPRGKGTHSRSSDPRRTGLDGPARERYEGEIDTEMVHYYKKY